MRARGVHSEAATVQRQFIAKRLSPWRRDRPDIWATVFHFQTHRPAGWTGEGELDEIDYDCSRRARDRSRFRRVAGRCSAGLRSAGRFANTGADQPASRTGRPETEDLA